MTAPTAARDFQHEAALDAARRILAAMLDSREACDVARGALSPTDFTWQSHGRIFAAVQALTERSEPVDVATVGAQLVRESPDIAQDRRELGQIVELFPAVPKNVRAHIRILLDFGARRQSVRVAEELAEGARNPAITISELVAEMGARLQRIEAGEAEGPVAAFSRSVMDGPAWDTADFVRPRSLLGDGLFCAGELGMIQAVEGIGKSFLTEQYAHALSSGERFIGLETGDAPMPVLVCHLELTGPRLKERRRGRYPVTPPLLHTFNADRLGRSLDILNPGDALALTTYIQQHAIQLVVFDPLQELHNVGETNEGFHLVVRAISNIMLRTGCAALAVHHESKPPTDDRFNHRSGLHKSRGGTRLTGGVKFAMRLAPVIGREGRFELSFSKTNYRETPPPMFVRQGSGGWFELTDAPEPAGDKTQRALDKFLLASAGGLSADTLARMIGEAGGASTTRAVQNALDRYARERGFKEGRAALQIRAGRSVLYVHPTMKCEVDGSTDFIGGASDSNGNGF